MDFLIMALFFLSTVLFIMSLSYLDICFQGLTKKLLFTNNSNLCNVEEYRRYQGKATLILSVILLCGIFIYYLAKSGGQSTDMLDYWTILLVTFSAIYGRTSRKYYNTHSLRKK